MTTIIFHPKKSSSKIRSNTDGFRLENRRLRESLNNIWRGSTDKVEIESLQEPKLDVAQSVVHMSSFSSLKNTD